MKLVIGNPFALEGYRLPESDDPERVHYRPLPGERETSFYFPEGMSVSEAASVVVETIPRHMDLSFGPPAWVECDDALLRRIICNHFGVSEKVKRPARWGDGENGPYKLNPEKEST